TTGRRELHDADRRRGGHRYEHGGKRATACQRTNVVRGVEHRRQSAAKPATPRERERRARRHAAVGYTHEQFRVVAPASSGSDDTIIAGLFAVFAERADDPPDARMKPEKRTHGAPGDVEGPVSGSDMRELVRQRHSLLGMTPALAPHARDN